MPDIHPSAIVSPQAELADDVSVGPQCFIGPNVHLGAGNVLHHGAHLEGHTILGERNEIFPFAVLGTIPQDKKYEGEPSKLEIGSENVIREHVTINIGTDAGGGVTRLGDRNLLMAGVHVGHDCVIGNDCTLANTTGLAGHVTLQDFVTLGGQTGIHQFVRVGKHCMVSGGSKVGKDIPPFTIAQGYPARLRGINQIGLGRRGFSGETIKTIRQAYRAIFFDPDTPFEDLLNQVREKFAENEDVSEFLGFLEQAQSDRGFLRPLRSEDPSEPQKP